MLTREENERLTRVGPGTPVGNVMRRYWWPVWFSDSVSDRPVPVRLLGEDFVLFRDGAGRAGLLDIACPHRRASLALGRVEEKGIRCCYHGFQFDVDGRILDVPAEADRGEKLSRTVSQGAYPTLERDGLVFAYFGPPGEMPAFPQYDAFEKYDDTRLVPFSNVYPCNWLQIMDNIADQIHTYILHNTASLYDGDLPPELDASAFTL